MKKFFLYFISIIATVTFYARYRMNVSKPDKLNLLIDEIENKIEFGDVINLEVSKVDVAWHLGHNLKVINTVCDSLLKSNPENFKSSFNMLRVLILTFGVIPRGKAKVPKYVRPSENISTNDLHSNLTSAKQKVKSILELERNAHFYHPIFHNLNKPQTLRFLEVHTNHHLKIVRDILKK